MGDHISMTESRLTRPQYFVERIHLLERRSTCLRGQVGTIIVRDTRVIAEGFNGAPPGMPHCFELGCLPEKLPVSHQDVVVSMSKAFGEAFVNSSGKAHHDAEKLLQDQVRRYLEEGMHWVTVDGCSRATHAEANSLAWAARKGIAVEGAEMWGTYSPCRACAQQIVSAGISKFVYLKNYRLERIDILDDAGLEVVQYGSDF